MEFLKLFFNVELILFFIVCLYMIVRISAVYKESMRLIDAVHKYKMECIKNNTKWEFDYIDLPSDNEMLYSDIFKFSWDFNELMKKKQIKK